MQSEPAPEPQQAHIEPYDGPAGGWGSLKGVSAVMLREHIGVHGTALLRKQNKPDGFACVSCAWAKLPKPHPFEFCENGVKATAWDLTKRRADPAFFARHTLRELEGWSDFQLEEAGRLTEPMRWDEASDRYLPVGWDEAFADIGQRLRQIDPKRAVFYASGRASLESSYLWQLFARLYGSNHLPDSSNMCHESSSVGLMASLGVPVGTVSLDDFEHTDAIFHLGQNVGTSSPRMLHQLQAAARRGVPIVVFNPLRERGLERFVNPQAPTEMLTGKETRIATHYFQLRNGGDTAALFGLCKALIEADDTARAAGGAGVLDHAFIAEHTQGFDAFAQAARAQAWPELERTSGLTRAQMEEAATVYARAERAMAIYGMGLTQQRGGVTNVAMVCNLLLLRGNVGRRGTGVCPVRGHSNVQGQRTVGITEKPELAPLDRLAEQYGFEPPRWKGHGTVEACEAIGHGEVDAFIALGGNFIRAVPDTPVMEAAWRRLPLTVQVATRLNRNHVIHGRTAYLLPCLSRIEIDQQATGPQAVSMEDSLAHFHGSWGQMAPASEQLLSEPRIVAGLARATLAPNPRIDWAAWCADYARVRQSMAATYPEIFKDMETAMWQPGGFAKPVAARRRQWHTASGKAGFVVPKQLFAGIDVQGDDGVLQLMTLRSNDQFNTTVYGHDDRMRGIEGTRQVVLMNVSDIERLGLADGQTVGLATAVDEGVARRVAGLRVVAYDIPVGCVAAYFPECNPLIPLWHGDAQSKVPGYKAVPVRVQV